ncbi:MAG: succinate dehydrogenase/fumarate reductase cytochrome b subunit [Gammaproteobacteria bacterium]|nr:succinate dehydrogenase/fumarate reductase cytochrome b subunit [Gammaproteobacteria bacterium]
MTMPKWKEFRSDRLEINPLPARLDFIQSASGLLLALFMWAHMFFVSSILLGKEAMYMIARFFEGYYIFGKSYHLLVTFAAASIFTIFIIHALVAVRKFPANYRQYRIFRTHMTRINHSETSLWFYQLITGFSLFFLASIHLYIMMTNPADIGPFASADRVISSWMWPLYIVLLLAVELHGTIGLYRLIVKWVSFEGDDAKKRRKSLRHLKQIITVFFLVLGFVTLAAYMKIGLEHKDNVGEHYISRSQR